MVSVNNDSSSELAGSDVGLAAQTAPMGKGGAGQSTRKTRAENRSRLPNFEHDAKGKWERRSGIQHTGFWNRRGGGNPNNGGG